MKKTEPDPPVKVPIEPLKTVEEAAEYFSVTTQSIYVWMRAGKLQGYRLPGAGKRAQLYTTRVALQAWAKVYFGLEE